jgi:hypothetical protein
MRQATANLRRRRKGSFARLATRVSPGSRLTNSQQSDQRSSVATLPNAWPVCSTAPARAKEGRSWKNR